MDTRFKTTDGRSRTQRSSIDLDGPAFRHRLNDPDSAVMNKVWKEVYAQLKGPSFAYMSRRLRLKDDVAEDLYQDAMLKAMVAWPLTNDVKNFGAWFHGILYHRCIDYFRVNKSKPESSNFDVESKTLRSNEPLPDLQAIWAEEGMRAISAHERIREERPLYAKVVEAMVNGEDYLSLPEVKMGRDGQPRSPGAIRTLIWSIRALYQQYMGNNGDARAE